MECTQGRYPPGNCKVITLDGSPRDFSRYSKVKITKASESMRTRVTFQVIITKLNITIEESIERLRDIKNQDIFVLVDHLRGIMNKIS